MVESLDFGGGSTLKQEMLLRVERHCGWIVGFRRWFHLEAGNASEGGTTLWFYLSELEGGSTLRAKEARRE